MPLPEPVFLKALNISVKFCIPLFYLYTQSKFYTEVYPKPLLKATLHLWLTALKIPAQVAAFSSSHGGEGGTSSETAQHTAYSRICRPRIINKYVVLTRTQFGYKRNFRNLKKVVIIQIKCLEMKNKSKPENISPCQ